MIKVDKERAVYALIGGTHIFWGPVYFVYRKWAAYGRELCKKHGIRVEIVQDEGDTAES